MSKRRFLFLQGVASPFFHVLGRHLRAAGHEVFKVNFNAGDAAYWWGGNAFSFRGRLAELRDFYDRLYRDLGITDQVLFGDCRPVHRPAVTHAEFFNIRTHVFEEGYFRPHWVTLERVGVNGHSLLPRDPEWFWAVGGDISSLEKARPFSSPFIRRAAHDVAYHVAGLANPVLFPGYRNHAGVIAPLEYLGYMHRFSKLRFIKPRDAKQIAELLAARTPYFVLPLQLNIDAQIRDHSRFEGMDEVIKHVMASFARHAAAATRLVIKNHPLDMGLMNYLRLISAAERRYGLEGRVVYLESGNLDVLLQAAAGVVTVNSTVGSVALGHDCPTLTLSDPIYNLPGLTFQGGLDDFWTQAEAPNRELFRRFRNAVIQLTQVNGGFYCKRGIALAVKNSMPLLVSEQSPLEAWL